MDRLNSVHQAYRVQLPESLIEFEQAANTALQERRRLPLVSRYVGVFGFVLCGAIVIITASFLALNI